MAKSYVKFEAPKEIVDKSLDALRLAKQGGSVKKGVNEVTKSIERGTAELVLIAADVEPEEVVMHLPTICEQKKKPFVFIPAKLDLGKAAGLGVPCAAVAIEKAGEAQAQVKEVVGWASTKQHAGAKQEAKPEAAKQEAAPKEQAKPKQRKKEAPKEQPKEQPKEEPKNEQKEQQKEQPKAESGVEEAEPEAAEPEAAEPEAAPPTS